MTPKKPWFKASWKHKLVLHKQAGNFPSQKASTGNTKPAAEFQQAAAGTVLLLLAAPLTF